VNVCLHGRRAAGIIPRVGNRQPSHANQTATLGPAKDAHRWRERMDGLRAAHLFTSSASPSARCDGVRLPTGQVFVFRICRCALSATESLISNLFVASSHPLWSKAGGVEGRAGRPIARSDGALVHDAAARRFWISEPCCSFPARYGFPALSVSARCTPGPSLKQRASRFLGFLSSFDSLAARPGQSRSVFGRHPCPAYATFASG
jgi:hypothetical protein